MKSLFKFQYDNTLSDYSEEKEETNLIFKFQYDNTLSVVKDFKATLEKIFKFQYDNTLRNWDLIKEKLSSVI